MPAANAVDMELGLIEKVLCLFFLYALSRQDCRWKKMDAKLLYAFLVIGLACFWLEFLLNIEAGKFMEAGMLQIGKTELMQMDMLGKSFLLRVIPGVLFLVTGMLTNERIGYGDGLAVLAMGFLMEPLLLWKVLGISMVLATVYGNFIILWQKQKRNGQDAEYAVPYLPFLLMGMVVMLCVL